MNLSGKRWTLLSIYIPTILFSIGQGLLIPIVPIYAAEMGGSYTLAGIVVAAVWFGTMVADLPAGMYLPKIGFRNSMMLGTGLYGVSVILLAFANMPYQLIIFQLIAGVGVALFSISRHAYITHVIPPEGRGKAIAVFGGLNRIGHFIGPAIGGFLATVYSLEVAIIVAGIISVLIVIITLAVIREPETHQAGKKKEYAFDVIREVVNDNPRALIGGGLAQIFAQMIRAGRQIVIPLYGAYAIGLDPSQVGQIVSASSLIDMALFVPAGIIMDRWGRKAAAVPSFAIMGGAMILIPLTSSYLTLMIVGLLIGFGNGIGSGTMMTIGSDLSPPGRTGEFLGMWRLIGDSGHVAAPLIIGATADGIGLAITAGGVGSLGFLSAGTLIFFVKETRWDQRADKQADTPSGDEQKKIPEPRQ